MTTLYSMKKAKLSTTTKVKTVNLQKLCMRWASFNLQGFVEKSVDGFTLIFAAMSL